MDQGKYEDILNAAIQSEIDANRFYQQIAERVRDSYLKDMFLTFAREEEKHRRILEGFLSRPGQAVHFAAVPDFHVSETVNEPVLSIDMKPRDAIALAMKKEETAMNHYNQLAAVCDDHEQKNLFLELASMEREHKARMEKAFVDIGYPEIW